MLGLFFITYWHHIADIPESIREIYHRIISPATNRANVLCQHRTLPIRFISAYLRSTFAHSEGQAWLCIAAWPQNVERLTGSSKFCYKYLDRNNKYMMIMTVILRDRDHRTFIYLLKSIIYYFILKSRFASIYILA